MGRKHAPIAGNRMESSHRRPFPDWCSLSLRDRCTLRIALDLLLSAALASIVGCSNLSQAPADPSEGPPSIVFILVDDLGYAGSRR